MASNNKAIILIGIGLIIGAVVLAIMLYKPTASGGLNPPAPPPPGCGGGVLGRFAAAGEFYSLTSNGGSVGRNTNGDYVVNGKVVEVGLGDAKSMGAPELLLTYAHGHPFYGTNGVGSLTGNSWSEHARGFAPSLKRCGPQSAPDKILVIEKGMKMCLDTDASFEGLVIRHGGQVLVAGTVTLKVQFLMIESGGLFQAGSAYDDKFRFDGKLTILLAHSDAGYATMGCPTSQYSYQVYAPGVTTDFLAGTQNPTFAPYTGMTVIWNNTYGPKSVCVGFNGNYHLAGALGPKIPYTGTWNAKDLDTGKNIFSPADRLSIGTGSEDSIPFLPSSYAVCWASLAPGQYKKGDTTVKIDVSDSSAILWWAGKEVVLLACPRQYTTEKPQVNPTGLLPVWVNNKDPSQQKANSDATATFLKAWPPAASINGPDDGIPGIEVQKVKSVGADGTLTLESPLLFDHSTGPKKLSRSFGSGTKNIQVDCPVHVGVLTRNILVTSELRAGGSGCNVLYTKSSLTSMLPGRAGETMPKIMKMSGMQKHAEHLEAVRQLASNAAETLKGPGGSVICNTDGQGINPNLPIFEHCYKDLPYDFGPYCGNEKPVPGDQITGHWLWGTAGSKGCGSIHGGQQMFRYGSAVCIDSAEMKYMGTPGNFGAIGQYAVHFHLCGYGKSFTGYLPSGSNYPREYTVRNSALWLSLSRWITVHGTAEAEISNNVGFMTFGSGYFVEDGAELYNIFDHNLGAYAIPGVQSDYLNSTPLFPNVSSDFAQMAVFWFKNNGNFIARNVAACCPSPVIGYWMVPQPIASLRGPASLVLGSEPLQLPGLQARGNAIGSGANHLMELSQSGNDNSKGQLKSVAGDSTKTACWVPDNFPFPLTRNKNDRCLANTTDNSVVPFMGFMENVAYAIFMFIGEMPEMLVSGGLRYDLSAQGAIGVGSQLQDNKPRAQWMPINGQNACTDKIISVYPETVWSAELPYQPLTDQEILNADYATASQDKDARSIPKILSGSLGFCLGPFMNLWGGAAWLKQMAVWNINSAFIDTADDNSKWGKLSAPEPGLNKSHLSDTRYSTMFIQGTGDALKPYNKVYPVAHNFISNGYVSIPPNPSFWSGDKTFYADRCIFMSHLEEPYNCNPCTGINKIFFDFGDLKLSDVMANPIHFGIDTGTRQFPGIFFYSLSASQLATVDMATGKWSVASQAPPGGGNQTKFPFVCKDDRLRLASDGQDSDFNKNHGLGEATANLVTGHFYTSASKTLGNIICKGIYAIPPTLGPQGWPGTPAACGDCKR